MKQIKIILIIAGLVYKPFTSLSQALNWEIIKKEQKHILSIYAGIEDGLIYGADYGYQLKSGAPIILNAGYSFPSGNKLFDDFKAKIGGQIRFYRSGSFHFSAKLYSVVRRYESDFARLVNFGTDFSATIGYYKTKWFVAGEAGFDKAIITHFKHTETYKTLYPLVKDGWFEPATGGNFYYDLQTGYSFKKSDIYVKVGKIISQGFKTQPLIPFLVQLGVSRKFDH